MAPFFIATLCVSIVGLLTLIGVKRWELSTGRVAMRGVRPAVGGMLAGVMHFIERIAPAMVQHWARRLWGIARVLFHRYVAWSVLWVERFLERTLHRLRHTTNTPRQGGEASAFLVEVAKHKKKLLKRPKQERTIVEE